METVLATVAKRLRNDLRLEKMLTGQLEAMLHRLRTALGDAEYDRALEALAGPDPESGEDERQG